MLTGLGGLERCSGILLKQKHIHKSNNIVKNDNKTCDLNPTVPFHSKAPGSCGCKKMLGVQSFKPLCL